MPTTLRSGIRLQRRTRRPACLPCRAVRPSILDLRFTGDAWIANEADACSLLLGGYQLTTLAALPLDLPSLNTRLLQLRQPNRRSRSE